MISKTAAVEKEQERDDGLFAGHAYSVLGVRRAGRSVSDVIKDTHASGVTLIRLRNPWGGSTSWNGAWSQTSSYWESFPEIAKEVGFSKVEDGEPHAVADLAPRASLPHSAPAARQRSHMLR